MLHNTKIYHYLGVVYNMFLITYPSFLYTHSPKPTEFNYKELRTRSSHMAAFMNMNNFVLKRICGNVDKGQTG